MPRVSSTLTLRDHLGTLGVRTGFYRHSYRVVPGLYAVGLPTESSPVVVTANYKLTFDVVRRDLAESSAWLLVIDTRGINVWCAAGKHLFSTREILRKIHSTKLDRIAPNATLILPQLGAPGVSAHTIKRECGMTVKYGPVRSTDLVRFIKNGFEPDTDMRAVSFTLKERSELIPVEITNSWRYIVICLLLYLLLGGIGPWGYDLTLAWQRGLSAFLSGFAGFLGGTAVAPLLLPHLPGRMFWLKGALAGLVTALPFALILNAGVGPLLMGTAFGSYMMMNFTGSTPYTSPTGVEYEMKLGLPFQFAAALIGLGLWLAGPFI
ncbi:mercury methylation corrinoid protein HgcA [Salidesulfovibrio brasiliensis]